jgi:hypothetical protein
LLTSLLAVMKLLLLAIGLVLLQLFRAAKLLLLAVGLVLLQLFRAAKLLLLAVGLVLLQLFRAAERDPAAGSEWLLYWLLLAAGLHRGLAPPLLRSSARSQLVQLQPVDLLSFLLERRRRFVKDVPPT